MKEIKPTYCTFEQSKWLKEKGFDEKCNFGYNQSEKYLGAFVDIINKNSENIVVSAPEQWAVAEWLRVNHGIWVQTPYSYNDPKPFCWTIVKINEVESDKNCWLSGIDDTNTNGYDTPQEAYSAAFDYIKDNKLI